jgi:hypothetical protein
MSVSGFGNDFTSPACPKIPLPFEGKIESLPLERKTQRDF